jgi:hypothetical protein
VGNFYYYTTKGNVRWDNVAQAMYGSVSMIGDIIRANPEVPITGILPDGLVLKIPIVATTSVQTPAEKLPIWKQS